MWMKKMALVSLDRAYNVDEEINNNDKSIVIVRFRRESKKNEDSKKNDETIKQVDDWLKSLKPVNGVPIKVYTVEMKTVPELVARYKLVDPATVLFFRNNIQGGRLQGDIKKDEITKIVNYLATEQQKPREPTKTPAGNNSSAIIGDKSDKTETPFSCCIS